MALWIALRLHLDGLHTASARPVANLSVITLGSLKKGVLSNWINKEEEVQLAHSFSCNERYLLIL